MTKISARTLVGGGFPPDQGKLLADKLLQDSNVEWDNLSIDLSGVSASLIISAFFNGFMQEIHDKRAGYLEKVKNVQWLVPFDFQKKSIEKWVREFKPVNDNANVRN